MRENIRKGTKYRDSKRNKEKQRQGGLPAEVAQLMYSIMYWRLAVELSGDCLSAWQRCCSRHREVWSLKDFKRWWEMRCSPPQHLQAFNSAVDRPITPQHYKELLMETNTLTWCHFVRISSDLDVKCYSWLLLGWDSFRPEFDCLDLQQSH